MKKIIALLLILVMACSFTACDDESNSNNDSDIKSSTSNTNKKNKKDETTIPEYAVQFISNGGTVVNPITTDKLNTAPTTTKKHHDFEGWYVDSTLTQAAVFPMNVKNDTTLYAKWLKTANIITFEGCAIKDWNDQHNATSYSVTPSGFDFAALQAKGYRGIEITVTYNVYYKKDYEIGIGYAGSPKYEISLANQNNVGKHYQDLTTNLQADSRSISTTVNISDINTNSYKLKVSTNNIQNIIYFENIVVTYTCYK